MKFQSTFHRSLGILIVATVAAGGLAAAQDEEAAGRPDRMLRLLPLGEPPPWAEINDGVRRVEKEAPVGSRPPNQVVQMTPDGDERGDAVRLSLGQVTPGLAVAGASVNLFDVEEVGAGADPWLQLKMSNKSHNLAYLWRDFTAKKWTTPRALILPEDVGSFPAGALRFVNISPFSSEFTLGGQTVRLEPGKHATVRPRGAFEKLPLLVNILGKDGAKMKVGDEDIKQGAADRTTVVVYFADGVKPLMPAKVKVLVENTRSLPQLPKR